MFNLWLTLQVSGRAMLENLHKIEILW